MAAVTSLGGGGGGSSVGGVEMIFNRRIEFHQARKPYSAVSSASDNGFCLETLNPSGANQKRPHELAFGAENTSSASGKRAEGGAEFYEHGLDQELGFRITFRRIVSGVGFLFCSSSLFNYVFFVWSYMETWMYFTIFFIELMLITSDCIYLISSQFLGASFGPVLRNLCCIYLPIELVIYRSEHVNLETSVVFFFSVDMCYVSLTGKFFS